MIFFGRPAGGGSTISGQNENHFRYAEFFLGYTTSRETEMQKAWVRERTLHRKKILQHRNSLKEIALSRRRYYVSLQSFSVVFYIVKEWV